MAESIFRGSRERPEVIPAPPLALAGGAPLPARPNAAPPAGEGASCEFATPARNGRVPRACAEPKWSEQWSSDLADADFPSYLLGTNERVFVGGSGTWLLSKVSDGESVANGRSGIGNASLSATRLLRPNKTGRIESLEPGSGGKQLWHPLFMGDDFERPFLAEVNGVVYVQGVEMEEPHGSEYVPTLSSLERVDLGRRVRPSGQLQPGIDRSVLFTNRETLVAAWSGGAVTVEPGRVIWFVRDLDPVAVALGEFHPVALSLDEEGWSYLIVEEPDPEAEGRTMRSLWVLDPQGSRRLRRRLEGGVAAASTPPLVSVTHRVTLLGGGRLETLSATGDPLWGADVSSDAAGAIVALDDTVLVSDGSELVAFDAEGERRVLRSFERPLCTPPVLTASGKLLVADAFTLHCLEPTPSED